MPGQPPHGSDSPHDQPPRPSPQPGPQTVGVRPSAAQYRSLVAQRGFVALALIAVLLAASDSAQEVAIKLVLCVVTATVAVAAALRMLRTCRVEASPGWIRYTRATGKQVLVDLTSARGILGKQARTRIDLLVVVSAEGKRLFHMSTDLWRPQDLRTITRLGGFVVDADVHRIEDWETHLPGSMRLVDRHPYALGVLLAIIIVAAAVLIAVTML